ncbi:hypothetical protein ScPMuIL_003088 [Solemya velum]
MFVQCVAMLSMVSVSFLLMFGSTSDEDHLPLVREATSRIVSRLAESGRNVHIRQQKMSPSAVAAFMMNSSDEDGDRHLDANELWYFFKDRGSMSDKMAEMLTTAFLLEGDKDRDGELSSGELANLVRSQNGFF